MDFKKTLIALFATSVLHCSLPSEANPSAPPPDRGDPLLPPAATIAVANSVRMMSTKPQVIPAVDEAASLAAGTGEVIGMVRINPALLARPANPIKRADGSVIGFGLPAEMAKLQLSVASQRFELYFFDEQRDPRYGLRHVTMDVLNHDGEYARFSVDDHSGLVYGTIHTPTSTIRILPTADLSGPRERKLEWRHRQLESLATIAPYHAETHYESRSASVSGGNLGNLQRVNAAEFVRAAARLTAITQFSGTEKFQISATVSTANGGRRIRLQQLIGGIPVAADNMVVTDASGKILHLTTSVVAADVAQMRPLLSPAQASSRVVARWEALESRKFGTDLTPQGRLLYRPKGSLDEIELLYEFRFVNTATGLEYIAYVNAIDGTTEVLRLVAQNFGFKTCDELVLQETGFTLPSCTQGTAPGVIAIKLYAVPAATGYTCPQPPPATGTAPCAQTDAKNVYEVLNGMRNTLPAVAATSPGGACCTDIGTIEVIQDARHKTSAAAASNGVIFIPPNAGNSAEIVGHEFAHIYLYKYADLLTIPPGFAAAVVEGTADTIAGLFGAISGNAAKYGDAWVYGDGPGYVGQVRSASNPNFKYWQDMKDANRHDAGQVIYRFYRRLKEVVGPSLTHERLLGIVLATVNNIVRGPDGFFDAGDFRTAVINATQPGETAIRNAVDAVYSELYDANATGPLPAPLPPGTAGPVGAPAPPASHFGSFAMCGTFEGQAVSIYQTFWTASTGASQYGLYAKGNDEPAYRFTDSTPGSQTNGFIFTNIAGDGRVNACNINGCSALSGDRVVVTHQPQCGGG